MAPSSGTLLLPKAVKVLKSTLSKTHSFIRSHLLRTTHPNVTLQPILAPLRAQHPIHPLAALRQSRRHITTAARTSTHASPRPSRASFPVSKTSTTLARQHLTPFASPLRPNLATGTIPRGANGSVRAFSSTPASNAQVITNVSAAVRAFWTQGHRAQYDGMDQETGAKRFRQVSVTQEKAARGMRKAMDKYSTRGASVTFRIAPTVTAFSPFAASTAYSVYSAGQELETEAQAALTTSTMAALSTDFARALRDLAAVTKDLERLSKLGDLPLSLSPDGTRISVRFPGCDARVVEALCDEVGVVRGVVREDEGWGDDRAVEMALLFPFAPSREESDVEGMFLKGGKKHGLEMEWRDMLEPTLSAKSVTSAESGEFGGEGVVEFNPWEGEGYESLRDSDLEENDSPRRRSSGGDRAGYEGIEGIYRFLNEIDGAKR